MEQLNLAQRFAVWILPVLFAITVHEVAHGWVAKRLGDPTAMMLGRLTLNPIKHIDPFGTILVPGILLWAGGVIFGWARPVPVTWQNLKHPKRDMAIVALAGPTANLLMAFLWVLVVKGGLLLHESLRWLAEPVVFMGIAGVFINTVLMVLNLLPLPPLDGGRVLTGVLPDRFASRVARVEPYGLIILVVLLVTGLLGQILWPAMEQVQDMFAYLAGIPPATFHNVLLALVGLGGT